MNRKIERTHGRAPLSKRQTGAEGEQAALRHLLADGMRLVERNWRCRLGEIDLVMRDGDEWVFVEVRAKRSEAFGTPEQSVTPAKQRKLRQLAAAYLMEHRLEHAPHRIDLAAVELRAGGAIIRHLRHIG